MGKMCESCRNDAASGENIVYIQGDKSSEWQAGALVRTNYNNLKRRAVFLCKNCVRSLNAIDKAIQKNITGDVYWLPGDFPYDQLVKGETHYVIMTDMLKDELPDDGAAKNATISVSWTRKGFFLKGNPVLIFIDGVIEAVGSFMNGFNISLKTTEGTHKLTIGCGFGKTSLEYKAETNKEYKVELKYSKLSGQFKIIKLI
ncbi:MAG: hypothetical protein JW822_06745 [Spirochaetales bacterium]|nr:hypothetical protein [Spirochaetales bacterium]